MSEGYIDDISWDDLNSDEESEKPENEIVEYSELDLDLKLKKLELRKIEIKQQIISLEMIRTNMREEYKNIINKKLNHFIGNIITRIEIRFAMAAQYLISIKLYENLQTLFRNNITKNDSDEDIMRKIIKIAIEKGWNENK